MWWSRADFRTQSAEWSFTLTKISIGFRTEILNLDLKIQRFGNQNHLFTCSKYLPRTVQYNFQIIPREQLRQRITMHITFIWHVLISSKLCLLTDHLCSFSLPMRAGQSQPNLPKTYEEDKIELAADIQDTQNAKVLNTKANLTWIQWSFKISKIVKLWPDIRFENHWLS